MPLFLRAAKKSIWFTWGAPMFRRACLRMPFATICKVWRRAWRGNADSSFPLPWREPITPRATKCGQTTWIHGRGSAALCPLMKGLGGSRASGRGPATVRFRLKFIARKIRFSLRTSASLPHQAIHPMVWSLAGPRIRFGTMKHSKPVKRGTMHLRTPWPSICTGPIRRRPIFLSRGFKS